MGDGDGMLQVGQENVCRDYMRNVCTRGNKCRFKHPPSFSGGGHDVKSEGLQDKVMFCHDFQNNRCSRTTCKFIHCAKDIEASYLSSGYLPPIVRDQAISKGIAADSPVGTGGVPVCKDYLAGKCSRRNRCKFRHLNSREYDIEMGNASYSPPENLLQTFIEEGDILADRRGPNDRKRRFMEAGGVGGGGGVGGVGNVSMEVGPPPQAFFILQEENLQLKGRIGELEKKVSDLLATNEFLLDQNAQLRLGGAGPLPGARPPPPHMFGRLM